MFTLMLLMFSHFYKERDSNCFLVFVTLLDETL